MDHRCSGYVPHGGQHNCWNHGVSHSGVKLWTDKLSNWFSWFWWLIFLRTPGLKTVNWPQRLSFSLPPPSCPSLSTTRPGSALPVNHNERLNLTLWNNSSDWSSYTVAVRSQLCACRVFYNGLEHGYANQNQGSELSILHFIIMLLLLTCTGGKISFSKLWRFPCSAALSAWHWLVKLC